MCELDQISGVQEGYSSKLFCGNRNFGWVSLGLVLGALGVEIMLVPGGDEKDGIGSASL